MLHYSKLVRKITIEETIIDQVIDYNLQDLTSSISNRYRVPTPKADTIFLIMHTSGTRGEIKGAMLTHRNLLSGFANCDFFGYDYSETDIYLSYIPLNHVYEQLMINSAIFFGYRVGFLNPMNPNSSPDEIM